MTLINHCSAVLKYYTSGRGPRTHTQAPSSLVRTNERTNGPQGPDSPAAHDLVTVAGGPGAHAGLGQRVCAVGGDREA